MRRVLSLAQSLVLVTGVAVMLLLTAGSVAAAPAGAAATPGTDPPITLAEGRSLTECISANPKPGCTTASGTDWHMVAVFAVLIAGMLFVFWRISRSIRRRDRELNARA